MANSRNEGVDSGLLITGFVVGLAVGAVVGLFKAPKGGIQLRQQISENGENLRNRLEAIVPSDPIAESLAEGKAAARRRRLELGLDNRN